MSSARLLLGSPLLRRPRSWLCSLFPRPIPIPTTHWPPCRAFSSAQSRDDLFNYTSGRWIYNDDLRHAERRLVFNVEELSRLAAEAVNRSPDDIVRLEKLAEGGANRTFLITMRCGFRMVARIPYPVTIPKYYAVASEVATMDFLRFAGLPIPKVYGYSPTPNNAAGTEYIFMEFVRGIDLSDIWSTLGKDDIVSISRQLVQLESKMMSISFPAGGSLYYTEDLANAPGSATRPVITLTDERFCVGPDTSLRLWHGRRSQLDVDRGPYESAEAALVRGAEKELAYLRRFGRPLLPFQRMRREAYKFQKQPPSDHIENLERYLLIASSLVPRSPVLNHFCIRHPDLQSSNIFVSRSADSTLHIAGLIDWQHTSILPVVLHTGIPEQLQNYSDTVSQSMKPPSLPEKFDELDETHQSGAMNLYRRRIVHYHYVKSTEEIHGLHYAAVTDPMSAFRQRLFDHASNPWEGETLALKAALIEATEEWETLTDDGAPCPLLFDAEDVRETRELSGKQKEGDEILEVLRRVIGFGPEGWVESERYEEAVGFCRRMREKGLAEAEEEEERGEIEKHWVFDDMDEEEYM